MVRAKKDPHDLDTSPMVLIRPRQLKKKLISRQDSARQIVNYSIVVIYMLMIFMSNCAFLDVLQMVYFFRFSAVKQNCNFTPKRICVKPNRTNVHNVAKHLRIVRIFRNIHVFILVLNRTDVKFVNANSHNYPTYNNI